MAGNCPHHKHLESTLKQYRYQTAVLAATHENYMSIIEDFKTDLERISSQMTLIQREFNINDNDGIGTQGFERSLKGLERLNDMLQATLDHITEDNGVLTTNNETLKCEIDQLQRSNCEKEQKISKLNATIARLSQAQVESEKCNEAREIADQELRELRVQLEKAKCKIDSLEIELERSQNDEKFLRTETRKINEDLKELRCKNDYLNLQNSRLATLLRTQEEHRMEGLGRLECLEENYEDQRKKLSAANSKLCTLQEQLRQMEKLANESIEENKQLKDDIFALKEKNAANYGKQKSVQDQLVKIEKELFTAHDVIKEQQCIMQRNETTHAENMKRLQAMSNDTKQQLACQQEQYKQLQDAYKKQLEVQDQNEKIINSFRKWKDCQIKADEATQSTFKQYEEHIRLLLEEKQKFVEQYRNLHRDYNILQDELKRLHRSTNQVPTGLLEVENSVAQRMELLRRTSRRLAEQSGALRESDDPCLSNTDNPPGQSTSNSSGNPRY